MRIPVRPILPALILLAASGQALAEDSLRHELLGSGVAMTLYSVDSHTTVLKTGTPDDVASKFEGLCSKRGASITVRENTYACEGVFEASKSPAAQETSFFIKTVDEQPLVYVNPSIPPVEELTLPPNGRIKGDHASVDIYQYMYALCAKENGTASVVISKRLGKVARYTEVGAQEAFDYLLSSGDGKDPWFFACEGETRFMVEKDYQYDSNGANKFSFHLKRGLEWVDYVKAEDGKVAKLEAR